MVVSYYQNASKINLLLSAAHSELDLCEARNKKPVVIEFQNSQRCGVDTVNQTACGGWELAVFTFLLDLATVNARTVPKQSRAIYDGKKGVFLQ